MCLDGLGILLHRLDMQPHRLLMLLYRLPLLPHSLDRRLHHIPPAMRILSQHQFRSILQRLCKMHGLDLLTPCQISNGSGQFENAMIGARRQIELGHRRPHQTLTLLPSTLLRTSLQPAKLPDLPHTHIHITYLHIMSDEPLFEKRVSCLSRAACTRVRIDSDDSLTRSPLNFS